MLSQPVFVQALDNALKDDSKGLDDNCSRIYHFNVNDKFKSVGLVFASPYVEDLLKKKVRGHS